MATKSPEMLGDLGYRIMQAAGATPQVARCVVDHLIKSNLMGIDSHGIMRLPDYVNWLSTGKAAGVDRLQVVTDAPATCLIDAHFTFGPVAATRACGIATDKARQFGVGVVSVRDSTHIGRLGHYVEELAEAGFIGFVCCQAQGAGQFVAPWGGSEARLTTNPLAWGFPSGRDDGALVMDLATSAAPEGKIRLAQRQGAAVPPGWIIDAQGRPSTDPADLHGPPPGAILPLGEHKGYALALVVEALSGALSSGGCSRPGMETYTHGCNFFLMAIRVDAFGPREQFEHDLDAMLAYVKSSPPLRPETPVRVPHELEMRRRRQRSGEGIDIDDDSWRRIEQVAASMNIQI